MRVKSWFFIRALAEKENLTHLEGAQKQLKYLWGFFNHSDFAKMQIMLNVDGIRKIKIENLHAETATQSLFSGAFEKVSYEAVIPVSACNFKQLEKIQIVLPLYPYEAYEMVKPENFLSMHYGNLESVINPCSFEEYVDILQPEKYWYTWDPKRKFKNLNGKKLDCADLLRENVHVVTVDAELAGDRPLGGRKFFEHMNSENEIDVLLAVGALHFTSVFPAEAMQKIFRTGPPLESSAAITSFLNETKHNKNIGNYDPDFLGMLFIIRKISETVEIKTAKLQTFKQHLELFLSGQAIKSKRKFNFKIYYGSTNTHKPDALPYVKMLLREIDSQDFVFYIGHSGLGDHFNLKQFAKVAGVDSQSVVSRFSKAKNQFYGIVSCYSNSYFGEDIFNARTEKEKSTIVMTTWSGQNIFEFVPAVLNYVEDYKLDKRSAKFNINLPAESFLNIAGTGG